MGRTVSNRLLRIAGASLSTLALLLQGCYETLPLQEGAAPTSVSSVELILNDKGRAAVADKLGTAVDKVEGIITAQNAVSYTLTVSDVYQLGGNSSKWSGEPFTIAKDWTVGYQIHRYSKTKTIVLVAIITTAAVVFLLTASLNGSGGSPSSTQSGSTNQTH